MPDFLTCSPSISGRASVAFAMHDLALSAAAKLNPGMNSARIALLMTVFMCPVPSGVQHAEIQQQAAPIGNGPERELFFNQISDGRKPPVKAWPAIAFDRVELRIRLP